MISDTNFLIELPREQSARAEGRASAFLAAHRAETIRVSLISAGEFATGFERLEDARAFLSRFPMVRLHPETCYEASRVDRELIALGSRLGENDNWIAGIARYYGESLVSNDKAFRRVPSLKLLNY